AIAELVDELPRVGRITFRALTGDLVERLEVVVRFLAVLELFKVGLVDLDQPRTFGEIEIVWRGDAGEGGGDRLAAVDAYDGGGGGARRRHGTRCPRTRRRGPGRRPRGHRGHRAGQRGADRGQPAGPAPRAVAGGGRRAVRGAGRRVRGRGPGLRAGPGGWRLAVPDPPRPGPLRRAVRPRRADRQAVGRRTRDPGHRGLQAAHLPGPGGGHPGRQRRRGHAHPPAAGLHRRGRPRPWARPGRHVRHHPGLPRDA